MIRPVKVKARTLFIFIVLNLLFVYTLSAQNHTSENLRKILKTDEVKKLSYNDLLQIQKNYGKTDKDLTLAYATVFLNRKDLLKDDSQRAEAYLEIGENYRSYGDNTKAEYYLKNSVKLFQKVKDLSKESEATNKLGIYYSNLDDDTTAIKLYLRSMRLANQNKDTLALVKPYKSLTALYIKLGMYAKALKYGLEGLELAKKIDNKQQIAALLNNIAGVYSKRKSYDTAIQYYRLALLTNTSIQDYEAMIRNLSNMGTTFLFNENYDSASKYLYKAEKLLPKIEVPRTFIYTYTALGEVKNLEKKYTEAIRYARKSIHYAKVTAMEGLSDGAYEVLVGAFKGLKMYDSALAALETYWSIKEKFLEKDRNESVTKVEQEFQQYKKEKEIELQKAEISLLKKDQTLGVYQRNAALIASLILAIALFLYYKRYKYKQRISNELSTINLKIQSQNQLIQSALSEKETLLREIHHRVKNNLQIISSLLNIQSAHTEDETTLSSIKEGQSRIQAMSLIHQNLYQSEHLSRVKIEDYLSQLIAYLSQTYDTKEKEVSVSIKAGAISFDIDTAIPLGLIVNELVSNAYKYAFEKSKSGKINIDLMAINNVDYELQISDNGVGLPAGFSTENLSSIGLKLVKILSRQLRGSFSFSSMEGAKFMVTFKDLHNYQLHG